MGSFTAATITVSTSGAAGKREDRSGELLRDLLTSAGAELQQHIIMPDDETKLREALLSLCPAVNLIVTTGGTGISPTDVTPEATLAILEKRLHGVEAALHLAGREKVPTAILSRGAVGTCAGCLIVNLPGSPGGVRDGMAVLAPILPHAIRVLRGKVSDCAADRD